MADREQGRLQNHLVRYRHCIYYPKILAVEPEHLAYLLLNPLLQIVGLAL